MTILNIDPLGTTTLACTTSTIADSGDDKDSLIATATGVATTIGLTGGIRTEHIQLTVAERYIDSLNENQLAEMIERLDQKQEALVVERTARNNEETPKQYYR